MTKEDKELMIKILCAMLPYNVMLHIRYYDLQGSGDLDERDVELTYGNIGYCVSRSHWVDFKPYLRPMSSMSEEECDMVEEILGDKCIFDFMSNGDIVLKQGQFSQNKLAKLCDYYASIHVDYRGLIEKSLAIEVTEENNPYE